MKKVTKETHLQLLLIILLIAAVILMIQVPFTKKAKVAVSKVVPKEQSYVAKPMSQEAKDLKAKLVRTDKYVGDLMVAEENQFKVEYLISNEEFMVTIKLSPYSESKKAAQEWFKKQGFSGFDLCTLQISFVPGTDVADSLTSADRVFDRCPVPDTEEATPTADLAR